jgi:hypothetical protein
VDTIVLDDELRKGGDLRQTKALELQTIVRRKVDTYEAVASVRLWLGVDDDVREITLDFLD